MTFTYDGTYEGLLSVIFETYRLKADAERITPEFAWQESLFEKPIFVATRKDWAKRVLEGVRKKTSPQAVKMLYRCYLSEHENIEMLIFDFVKKAMASSQNIEQNFLDATVLKLQQINKSMGREIHRMHAFVRFQLSKDDIYFSTIEPDFDVLPLITDHFEKRYPAQTWLIYDLKRHYGMFFNQEKTEAITFSEQDHQQLRVVSSSILEEKETSYQEGWKKYFKSTNIPARRNMKLHLQHVPKRYWKYLVEKE